MGRRWHVRTEAEIGATSLQAKKCKRSPINTRNQGESGEESPLQGSEEAWPCWHLDFRLLCVCVWVCVASLFQTLCNPIDCSPPGPSVHGILQARTLERFAIAFSKRNYRKKESEVTQSRPPLCDPMDCSLPGSSIHGIFQAGVLEWGAISFPIY